MPTLTPALTDMTADVVASYVAHNAVPSADIPALIATVRRRRFTTAEMAAIAEESYADD